MDYETNQGQTAKKSLKPWLALLIGPFVALFVVALLQMIAHFVFSGSAVSSGGDTPSLCTASDTTCGVASGDSPVLTLVNILSLIIGVAVLACLALYPIWIVLLTKTIQYNHATPDHHLSKTAAVLFAVFLSFCTWLYTYERDKTKFWINLLLTLFTLGLWGVVAWIWAIVDSASKSDDYYNRYPDVVR